VLCGYDSGVVTARRFVTAGLGGLNGVCGRAAGIFIRGFGEVFYFAGLCDIAVFWLAAFAVSQHSVVSPEDVLWSFIENLLRASSGESGEIDLPLFGHRPRQTCLSACNS